VAVVDSSGPDLIGAFNVQILFHGGLVYSTNGKVIDPEAYQVMATLPTSGPVAVDGNMIYWLNGAVTSPTPVLSSTPPALVLSAFDATTYAPLYNRSINVGSGTPSRLIPCGRGRLAFSVGNQIYIVLPQ
jgi:hypothetical protein